MTATLEYNIEADSLPEFVVDGSSLPDVMFDIGESYAGTMTNHHLYFWRLS